jgi:gamma-glutamylcyclotransferase (GGCT)/AIG2-like uncharacterized protein YtfP
MSEHLFVYGTLMDPLVQRRIIGRTTTGKRDTLTGYRKGSIQLGSGVYSIVRPHGGSSVEGVVIKITPAELRLIDRYESDAYQRKEVMLVGGQRAWVYQESDWFAVTL